MVTTRGLGQKEVIKLAMKGKNPVKLLVNGPRKWIQSIRLMGLVFSLFFSDTH